MTSIRKTAASILLVIQAIMCGAPANAQENKGGFKANASYLCGFKEATTRLDGLLVGKSKQKAEGLVTAIMPKSALHCSRSRCYQFSYNAELSKTTAVYTDEKGDRFTTNILAIELGAGVEIQLGNETGTVKITLTGGECASMTEEKIMEILTKTSRR